MNVAQNAATLNQEETATLICCEVSLRLSKEEVQRPDIQEILYGLVEGLRCEWSITEKNLGFKETIPKIRGLNTLHVKSASLLAVNVLIERLILESP